MQLYAMLDGDYNPPAFVQHRLIKEFAEHRGYTMGFYGVEDPRYRNGSPYLCAKLPHIMEHYHGVIFYSIFQLDGDPLAMIKAIHQSGLICLFALQGLDVQDLRPGKELYMLLSGLTSSCNRKSTLNFKRLAESN
jgi:hypothetical protein